MSSLQLHIALMLITGSMCLEENLDARRTSLAELPLEKLLHVKQSLGSKYNHKGDIEVGDSNNAGAEEETALPFRGDFDKKQRTKPLRRGDPWSDVGGKGKDVGSIFQSTVTVLSFLAFGGYLLCLLCQALRNQQAATPGVVTMMPPVAPAAIMGKKKRKRRSAEESMMRTLHLIAEGYAAYSLGEK